MKKAWLLIYLAGFLGFSCGVSTNTSQSQQEETAASATNISGKDQPALQYANPVLPGDYPDPSVTKTGDTYGKVYIYYTANSVKLPTPIWRQRMNEERTALLGEKFDLFRNDAAWEGGLVEGPSLIRRGDYFYVFYAADACCGRGCTYAAGVARAKKLTGPRENIRTILFLQKMKPGNVQAMERFLRMLQAGISSYTMPDNIESFVYAHCQGLLDEFTWNEDG